MKYGLIGKTLTHSFSPALHAMLGNRDYDLLELDRPEEFFRKRDFAGVNVTIPYKQAVIPLLDSLSPEAEAIGAVNTVVNRGGVLTGFNTDYYGVLALLDHAGVQVQGKKCLILGTGGTAKTVHYAFAQRGAAKITHVSRTKGYVNYKNAHLLCPDTQIIFNTTPVGMSPDPGGCPLELKHFLKLEAVLDAVYNPLRTRLVLKARERGVTAAGGLYMLAAQAEYADALFFDRPADPTVIGALYGRLLHQQRNICLVGMPTSGKTTIGRLLSRVLERPFLDLDALFTHQEGLTPGAYIESRGEPAFRRRESELIATLAETRGTVIATGGGAVLDRENVRQLKQNGILVWLDRPLDRLHPTGDRPLSSDSEALKMLYHRRKRYYQAAQDVTVWPVNSKSETVRRVLAALEGEEYG